MLKTEELQRSYVPHNGWGRYSGKFLKNHTQRNACLERGTPSFVSCARTERDKRVNNSDYPREILLVSRLSSELWFSLWDRRNNTGGILMADGNSKLVVVK